MRKASSASLILRVIDSSLVRRKFFATCWVMVEAPCGRPAAAKVLDVKQRGAGDTGNVYAGMLVKVFVFRGDERIDDELRHRLDGQIKPALVGVFRQQRTVGRVHARHHRRFIILQLRIVR